MANQVNVDGAALVKVGTGDADALEILGYTRNGAEVTHEAFFIDVPGDENGGDEGPPVEVEELGEISRVRCELTKFDEAVANKVRCRLKGGTAGTKATPGTLVFADSKSFRLAIVTTNRPLDFPRAIPRAAIEINKGTKFSTLIVEFECHKNASDVLYDGTI